MEQYCYGSIKSVHQTLRHHKLLDFVLLDSFIHTEAVPDQQGSHFFGENDDLSFHYIVMEITDGSILATAV